jgi:hypothetical protein
MVANGCSINGLVNGYLVAPVNESFIALVRRIARAGS